MTSDKVNADSLLAAAREAAEHAEEVLDNPEATALQYAEALGDLTTAFGELDEWITENDAEDLPSSWR